MTQTPSRRIGILKDGMIEVNRLSKRFQSPVVEDLTFQVAPGEVFGLLGPNGAGKTTTLRMLATMVRPSSGMARLAGYGLDQPREVRRRIGWVTGGMRLYECLTTWETLEFYGACYGLRGAQLRERIDATTSLLGLGSFLRKRVGELSSGMYQRLLLARAVLHRPPVLLLDEPTSGLDVLARHALLEFVEVYRDQGHSLIYSTHVMSEAEELCSRVGFLVGGRLLWQGSLAETKQWGRSLERAFVEALRSLEAM